MPLPGTWRSLAYAVLLLISMVLVLSCSKEPVAVDRNRPPDTFLVSAPVDTSVAAISYSYRIHLYWRGEDPDGYVVGYYWAFDDTSVSNFRFTTKTDSIFMLTVNDSSALTSGGGNTSVAGTSATHTFYIRAVDNLGKQDPSFAIWNRRSYKASTIRPTVEFTGNIPNLNDDAEIDTLCDATPFQVTWTGEDPDGIPGEVLRYKVDIATYSGPITTDTVAYFNDPSKPGAILLNSGLYTLSITGIDIANAIGTAKVQLVVNHDPETWILPQGAPIGHYIQHYQNGNVVNIESTFTEGATVPYRSTVWWTWDGSDKHEGGCEADPAHPNGCLTGWSFTLSPGSHNNNEPYTIGFLDTLSAGPPLVQFNQNDPKQLEPLGFNTLILDSLDAGTNFVARIASRDCSGRADGTPATFTFSCNFAPHVDSLFVDSVFVSPDQGLPPEPCKLIRWVGLDDEDGLTKYAIITLDGTLKISTTHTEQSIIVPYRTFRALSPEDPHTIEVYVKDRATIQSPNTLSVQTTLGSP
jgi:hypothetical protein